MSDLQIIKDHIEQAIEQIKETKRQVIRMEDAGQGMARMLQKILSTHSMLPDQRNEIKRTLEKWEELMTPPATTPTHARPLVDADGNPYVDEQGNAYYVTEEKQ